MCIKFRLENLKKQNCTQILIVAFNKNDALFIVRMGEFWRFTKGCETEGISFIGNSFLEKNSIKIASYNQAISLGFDDDSISEWSKDIKNEILKMPSHSPYLNRLKRDALSIDSSDAPIEEKYKKLLSLITE